MGFGLEGKKVRLVPLELEKHFENAYRWINDSDVTTWLGAPENPISRLAEEDWFRARMSAGPEEVNWAIETLSGEHIGFSNLFRIDYRNRTCVSGSLIGTVEHRGKGFGSDAARLRAGFAFEILNLNTLFSSYVEGNEASERMQTAAGYEIWGRQPNALWKRGSYRTMVHTYLTKDRWLVLRENAG